MKVLVFVVTAIAITVIFLAIAKLRKQNRADKISGWKVGDKLLIDPTTVWSKILERHRLQYAILLGVSLEEVVVSLDGGRTSQLISHSDVSCNKSAYWREIESRCATQMPGQKLGFHSEIKEPLVGKDNLVFEKDLSLLNETQLQIELKNALSSENYELADLIKKELERFR